MSKSKYRSLFLFVVIGIIILAPYFFSLESGKISIGGDAIIPLNPRANFIKYLSPWLEINGGIDGIAFLTLWTGFYAVCTFFVSLHTAQVFFIMLVYGGAFLGMYKLARFIFVAHPDNRIIALLAGAIYLYHPFHLNLMVAHPPLLVYPWAGYLFLRFIESRRLRLEYCLALAGVIAIGTFNDFPNPKYYLLAFLMLAVVSGVWGTVYDTFSRTIIRFGIMGCCVFFLHAFFLFPYTYSLLIEGGASELRTKAAVSDAAGLFADEGSTTVARMLQLHHNSLNMGREARATYLASRPVAMTPLIIWLILFAAFFVPSPSPAFKRATIFLWSCFTFLFFLMVGPNPPFGEAYKWLVNHTFLFISFRTTSGLLLPAATLFSLLLASAIVSIFRCLAKGRRVHLRGVEWWWIMGVTILLLVISYPMILGYRFANNDVVNTSRALSGHHGLIVPSEYYAANDWLQAHMSDTERRQKKVILLPPKSYEATNWGYFGPAMFPLIYDGQIIHGYNAAYTDDSNDLIVHTYRALAHFDFPTFLEDTRRLGVDYAVYQKDYVMDEYDTKRGPIQDFFTQVRVYTNTKVDIYDLKKLRPPAVSDVSVSSVSSTPSQVEPTIGVVKKSSTRYLVRVHDASAPFFLILNQTFNRKWYVRVPSGVVIVTHTRVNAYANQWLVRPSPGGHSSFDLEIRYFSQDLFWIGLMVSGGTVFALGTLSVVLWRKQKYSVLT